MGYQMPVEILQKVSYDIGLARCSLLMLLSSIYMISKKATKPIRKIKYSILNESMRYRTNKILFNF